jgi:hypothetical protein
MVPHEIGEAETVFIPEPFVYIAPLSVKFRVGIPVNPAGAFVLFTYNLDKLFAVVVFSV